MVGVDAAQGLIDHAKKTFGAIDFRVGAIEELAFDDDEFDVVFAANSVQYASEEAVRKAVEPLTAEDGTISFETNVFIFVVGK